MRNAECGIAVEGRAAGQGPRNGAGHDIPHSALRIPHSLGLLAPEPRRGAAIPGQFHREPARHRVRHGDRAAHARALLSPHDGAGRVGLLGNRRAARRVQRAHRVIEAVLRPGIGQLAGEVRSGELDLVLVKPVDAQGFVSFRQLDIWRLTDVVLGLGLAGYALFRLGHTPSLAQLIAFGLTLAAAAVVVYAIWVVLMSLAFWFVSVENIAVLFDAVYEGARYPASAYPGALRFLFVYLIPIAWTTTIPASALTGRLRPEIALVAAGVAAVAFALARALWRAALKRYTGASG